MNIKIEPYTPDRANEIADLYHASVHAIDENIYTKVEQEAWAPTSPNYKVWVNRLNIKKPFLATIDGVAAGFIELEDNGHIDCAYTHPKYQGLGVMSTLCAYIEDIAMQKSLKKLWVEASKVAKPFFEAKGFVMTKENNVTRNNVILTNYTMEKILE
jgi:putative acetyltransferase